MKRYTVKDVRPVKPSENTPCYFDGCKRFVTALYTRIDHPNELRPLCDEHGRMVEIVGWEKAS